MTHILGENQLTAPQLRRWYFDVKPTDAPHREFGVGIRDLVGLYLQEGKDEGVRGDLAFCQAIQETGWFKFGGDVHLSQHNYSGLGATGGGVGGASFKTPRQGVRAQVQHLVAYATDKSRDGLSHRLVDPRYNHVPRFPLAEHWQDLDGRWAVPGVGYGQKIVNLWRSARLHARARLWANAA